MKTYYKGAISFTVIIAFWQLASEFGWVNTTILPSPVVVATTFIELIVSGNLIDDLLISLWRVLAGFFLATFLGIGLGFMTSSNKSIKAYLSPVVEILRPIPPIAFVPMSILWFGIGNGPAYFIVCFGAFFPIFTNTFHGILSVNRIHINAGLCLGAKRRQLWLDVMFPAAMPYIAVGLKTGMGVAWFCVIAAELVGAQSGLGYMIQLNRLTLQSENVIAGMIMIGVIGYIMSRIMILVQKRLAPWSAKTL